MTACVFHEIGGAIAIESDAAVILDHVDLLENNVYQRNGSIGTFDINSR